MADSKTGTGNIQDEPGVSCSTTEVGSNAKLQMYIKGTQKANNRALIMVKTGRI